MMMVLKAHGTDTLPQLESTHKFALADMAALPPTASFDGMTRCLAYIVAASILAMVVSVTSLAAVVFKLVSHEPDIQNMRSVGEISALSFDLTGDMREALSVPAAQAAPAVSKPQLAYIKD
jgi:hypothetical protein